MNASNALYRFAAKYAILDALPLRPGHGKEVYIANGKHRHNVSSLCRGRGSQPLPLQMA